MGIQADDLSGGSLTGTLTVTSGQVRFDQTVLPIDFEGSKNFNIIFKLNDSNGPVLYQTANISVENSSSILSCTPNITTLYEGSQVRFAVTSGNVTTSNLTLYYSTAGNVNYNDFVGGNVGYFYLVNNKGNVVLTSNADLSSYVDTGEEFNLQLRLASTTGDVIFTSANAVNLIDSSNAIGITSIEVSNTSVYYGETITYTTTAFVPEGASPVYATLEGNGQVDVNVSGQLIFDNGTNVLVVTTTAGTSTDGEMYINIRRDGIEGTVIATSSTTNVLAIPIIEATGGTTYIDDGYKYHLFTTGGPFAVTASSPIAPLNTIEYLVLAGGGGGAGKRGGGGGAGGLVTGSLSATPSTSITVGVGGGGAGGPGAERTAGVQGTPSTLTGSVTVTAVGGGYGYMEGPGGPGGSGGGAGINDNRGGGPGGSGTPGQGNPGATATNNQSGGGGGGAGESGFVPSAGSVGGKGGNGTATYNVWLNATGRGVLYPSNNLRYIGGGGGGGGGSGGGGTLVPGGLGGGGPGGPGSGQPGTTNTGGGGGGGWDNPSYVGGQGGPGLVIIRYPISIS